MEKIDLTGKWKFRAVNPLIKIPSPKIKLTRWMDASVPGTIHTDLLMHKIIPDPYYRINELDVQWVDTIRWEYKRDFTVSQSLLDRERIELVAEGLDTYAAIFLNGKKVADTENMFLAYRIDVKKQLKPGRNVVRVVFDSPERRTKDLEDKYGKLNVAVEPHRVFSRKAQYSFGWDWGPKLTTSGIWRNIYIEAYDIARLTDPFVRIVSVTKEEAVLDISAGVVRTKSSPLKMFVRIVNGERVVETVVPVDSGTARVRIPIKDPALWWPNGYGDQTLYTSEMQLMDENGLLIDSCLVTFGIRTIRLLREQDDAGESFVIEVNGVKIFCKGANWIPADNFVPRIQGSTYESLLRSAAAAHMNMVRVWGGGIYEEDIFYDRCDKLGLMIWQDFMFACGEYPENESFIRNVRGEAKYNIRRLRNHPSVVLWCGNNECEYLFCNENPGKTPDDMRGASIFRDELASLCEENDGTRPYWRSSPFGTGHPNDESNGNRHQWDVWSSWKDYTHYATDYARFVTEFGFQAPAHPRTYGEITKPDEMDIQSRVMEHHNKQIEGTERLYRFQSAHYRITSDFNTFIYQGQLLQAEALKFAVEQWRRLKFHTAGSLFWQLNDCWPVSSWSVIDSALRPKAAYFYAKRFFSPVLISMKRSSDGVEVWITNDRLENIRGKIEVFLLSFSGVRKRILSMNFRSAANASQVAALISSRRLGKFEKSSHYLLAQFRSGDELLSENRLFFEEPKHLDLPDAGLQTELYGRKNVFNLKITAKKFAKDIFVDFQNLDATLSDNFFDLDAGAMKHLDIRADAGLLQLKKSMRIVHLR
jgi:beta-mannosidase